MPQRLVRGSERHRRAGATFRVFLVGAFAALLAAPAPAPAAEPPRWTSSTAGLVVRGVTGVRVAPKSDTWYVSAFGNAAQRMGLVEVRDKGRTWRPLRQGLEETATHRDHFEITVDPKDERTIYAVTRGKIFRTTNAGGAFENVGAGTITFSTDRSQSRSWIAGVAVDPSNSKRILAGTLTRGFYGGVFESKDGAKSWTQIAGTGDTKHLADSGLGADAWPISLDRTDKYVLVGGTTASAWLSEDRGLRFKLTQPGGPGFHRAFELTPMTGGEVFLAESRGLWRSRDRGLNWGKEPLLPGRCLSVAVDPTNRKVVYAVIEGKGLYRTENLTKWDGPLHGDLDPHGVYAHPQAKHTILLTSRTTGLWVSTDRGATFASAGDKLPEAVPAITHAAAHPDDGRELLAVTDTGWVFASQDGGAAWARPGNIGSPVTALRGVAGAPGTWLAAGAGVFSSTDLGGTWTQTLSSDDVEDRVVALVPRGDGALLALWERACEISVSLDGGRTWEEKPIAIARNVAQKAAWATGLSVDRKDPRHLVVSLRSMASASAREDRDGGPYESTDGGATWTLLDAGLKDARGAYRDGWNQGAGIALLEGALLYVVDGTGVFRMERPAPEGKTPAWTEVPLSGVPAAPVLAALAVGRTPTDGDEVMLQVYNVVTGTRVLLRSVDAGATFGSLPDPGTRLESLTPDPTSPGRYLTGDPVGDRGVLAYGARVEKQAPPPAPVEPVAPPVVPPPVAPAPAAPTERPVEGLTAFFGGTSKTVGALDLHAARARGEVARVEAEVLAIALGGEPARLYCGASDKSVVVLAAADLAPVARLEGHGGAVSALALARDGTRLYAGDEDWKITAWDLAGSKPLARYEGHTAGVTALALSPDGARLYSASRDRSVRAWDTATGQVVATVVDALPAETLALALSPDGTRVFVAGRGAEVRVFDAALAPVATYATRHRAVLCLAVSPDGATVYAGGDGLFVEALAAADGVAGAPYEVTGTLGLASLAVSADGRWLLGGGADGAVRLWRHGKPVAAVTPPAADAAGAVFAVALSPHVGEPVVAAPTPGPVAPTPGPVAPSPGPEAPAPEGPPTPPGPEGTPPAMVDEPPAPPAMVDEPPAPPAPPAERDTPAPPAKSN